MSTHISIIILCLHDESRIEGTLDSLLNQTCDDWDAQVLDIGGTGTREVISRYAEKDTRISHFLGQGGLSSLLRHAVRQAKGRYIAFCESGDELSPDSLEKRLAVLEEDKSAVLCFCTPELTGDELSREAIESEVEKITEELVSAAPLTGSQVFCDKNPAFSFSCVMVRSDILKKCDFYPPSLRILDWWLWRQTGICGNVRFLEEKLVKCHLFPQADVDAKQKSELIGMEAYCSFKRPICGGLLFKRIRFGLSSKTTTLGLLNIPIFRENCTETDTRTRILGIKTSRVLHDAGLEDLRRKARQYRILSRLPIPGLRKKWKKGYRKYKDAYQTALHISQTHGDKALMPSFAFDNEISLMTYYRPTERERILLISHEASNTGAPRALLGMGQVLKKNNYNVVFLTPFEGALRTDCEASGIPFIVQQLFEYGQVVDSHVKKFQKFASFFDVVIINSVNHLVVRMLEKVDVKKIWWLHEGATYFRDAAPRPDELLSLFRSVDRVYSVGGYAIKCTNDYVGSDIVGNFLYGLPDEFDPESVVAKEPGDPVVFGILGTIEPRKAQLEFTKAVAAMSPDLRSKAKFVILGNAKLCPEYSSQVMELGSAIAEVAILSELNHDEFLRQLANLDVIVSFSSDDPMPIVLTEGFMYSKPVICTDRTGTASLIRNGHDGFVVPSGDISALKEKFESIVQNRDILTDIGRRGRQIYDDNFAEEKFESNVINLVASLMTNR